MAGLVPAIQSGRLQSKTWMPGSSPGMTVGDYPPRTGGITTWSRRQARRSISSQARNCRSLLMQIRTSLSRRLSQVTEIAELLRPGLTLMKASSISPGAIGLRLRQVRRNSLGDFHRGAGLADGLEIGARAEPRAGAVLVPFAEDQPGRRHQVQHRGHDVAVEPRRRAAGNIRESRAHIAATGRAPRRKTAGRRTGLLRAPAVAALGRRLAERRRPRQRQHVEIELAGRVLPAVLGATPPPAAATSESQRNQKPRNH